MSSTLFNQVGVAENEAVLAMSLLNEPVVTQDPVTLGWIEVLNDPVFNIVPNGNLNASWLGALFILFPSNE